ncbi:cytochrome P450 [Pisolithus marmoratus]|nr:cytochrome P450 [Pisolithus marmoratus]
MGSHLRGALRAARRTSKTTKLRGPPRTDLIFGAAKKIFKALDPGAIYEAWAKEYGVVYEIPTTPGRKQIVLTVPRAFAHFYAREIITYVQRSAGILWSQGEDHKSQATVRNLTPIIYSSAHKAKCAWGAMIDASGGDGTVIEPTPFTDTQSNLTDRSRLDTIGLAGFSHDFGSLDGKSASITAVLDTFGSSLKRSTVTACLLLSQTFPFLSYAPTPRSGLFREMQRAIEDASTELLARTRKEFLTGKKIIKSTDPDSALHFTHEEMLAQMKVLLVAGFETTSKLLAFGEEPTYDQQQNSLPYLDAVVRQATRAEDDVIPLSQPVVIQTGEAVNSISVARGTQISVLISCINRSTDIWGADAKIFRPERWLEEDGIPRKAQDIQAYRHLLTFIDGPKTCLGKGFAAILFLLVKNFVFETRDGPNARRTWLGEDGNKVPLRVRRYEG